MRFTKNRDILITVLTRDLKEVDWPFSVAKTASFATGEQLEMAKSDDLILQCIALAPFRDVHLMRLYNNKEYAHARARRSVGRRILQANVAEYCGGYSCISYLYRVFGKFPAKDYEKTWKRPELVRALLNGG